MRIVTSAVVQRLLAGAAMILIFKVTLSVVIGYRQYWPPDFNADFLLGREVYFFGPYRWAFYAHLIAGPVSLVAGTILLSEWVRRRAPRWHRWLGRLQVVCILLVLVPSGLWMARYAMTGAVAGAGLGLLAIATALCTALGWRAAVARRFDEHRRWMLRTYVLLCSAVVIRLMGGLATTLQFDAEWVYPVSVWASWVLPLIAFECWRRVMESRVRSATLIVFNAKRQRRREEAN
jgi:small-conductance mechanosensitive channel